MCTKFAPYIMFMLLSGCTPEMETGPGEIRWDRETCTRCNMAIGDRSYAAQVRSGAAGQKSRLYKFDDLGCAVLWLDQQNWKAEPQTEIWVNDYKTGEWIEANKAWYIEGEISPMGYGLGARADYVAGAMNFEQAKKHIYMVEEKLNIHGGNLQHK